MRLLATASRHSVISTPSFSGIHPRRHKKIPMALGNRPTLSEPNQDDAADTTDIADTEDAKGTSLNRAPASISRGPSKSINLKAIAREHDVPYDTLRRRYLKKAEPKKLVRTHLRKLTPAQEQKAVDWSIFLSIQGRPVDKNTLTPKLSNSVRPVPILGVRQNTGGAGSSSGIPRSSFGRHAAYPGP